MADPRPPEVIGIGSAGSTMNPVYTQRRGMTYAVGEVDLMCISDYTAQSSRLYSFSGFLVGALVNIVVTYGGSPPPLTAVADFCLHIFSWILGVAALLFFVWGYSVTRKKNAVIDQIRRECGIEPKKGFTTIFSEFVRRQFERRFVRDPQSPESTIHVD